MTISQYEMLLDKQAKMVRKNGMCLSVVDSCETICDKCADYNEEAYKKNVKREVENAIRLLRSYGFTVEEK